MTFIILKLTNSCNPHTRGGRIFWGAPPRRSRLPRTGSQKEQKLLGHSVPHLPLFRRAAAFGELSKCKVVKFHYLKKLIYITEIVNAHYFEVHIYYFGSDLFITTTIVKFRYFTFREKRSWSCSSGKEGNMQNYIIGGGE